MATALVALGGLALYLAVCRIYQVDEAQNLFMARVVATGQTGAYFSNALLWMLGPLSWLARWAPDSASLFLGGRLIFLGIFFLNVVLLALNTGVRLRSEAGLVALLGAATLAPLWDYGFEVRHDNLILTGLLLLWWLGRVRPRGRASYVGIGFLAVVMVFVAFKAFAYVVPLSLAFLVFPPPGHGEGRPRLLAAWGLGAGLAGLLVFLAYWASGMGPVFLAGFHGGMGAAESGSRFGSWIALGRLLTQTPLLLGLSLGALGGLGLAVHRGGRATLAWEGSLPEALLLLGALGILLINPTPFPYNLVNLVPFAYLLAFRFAAPHLEPVGSRPGGLALVLAVVLTCHLIPFLSATWRHLGWTNHRQELLMRTAESMTDPAKDRVYDAIGMVPSRGSIGYHWYLHSLNLRTFMDGEVASVPQMLVAQPAAVFIPSYRTDWLPDSDHRFIASRYVPLADDFWVLGQILPEGGGSFEVVHAGRYQVLGLKGGAVGPLPSGSLDGQALPHGPVALGLGPRKVQCPPGYQPVVVWVGPRLDDVPQIGPGDHRRLFVNWY
ncbi:MAG TPA: hypothetical protein VF768_04400 [Holophagaceae bacterium]